MLDAQRATPPIRMLCWLRKPLAQAPRAETVEHAHDRNSHTAGALCRAYRFCLLGDDPWWASGKQT